ncbi:two-component system, NtrC family, nitrogen regulation response regulator NtrX [Mariprofundus ferrinatatus]|uniref:Two-component system, NtrC family, nitrogen regulation response regulator NtrX n=1 Tax=Mariprofundus ferrinatatus TaxID=1921087 RepID=A0A2K8L8D1_9PROT|nr:sigma-54 dependent transcriptional regulator [Mariprofundus ferrinatatus]ATX82499.1 two-component system, NtrC family, nitrogen regulation response regulator NtrX [Mariprofundus ferrinatatus]
MTARIMIVDDEQPIRDSLQGLFEDENYLVVSAASGEEAIARLRKQSVDCVLLDIWMPGIDGLETLSRIQQVDAGLPVIMMSGHATIDTAVRATRQGAFDFVEKPLSFDRLMILARNAVQKRRLEQENSDLKQQEKEHQSRRELIGNSAVIKEVKALIKRVALSDTPVLILGEHGTGKAVAATLLHEASKRKEGPFIEVNTASVMANRLDSELFGHEKGAFTGALHSQRGRFEAAHQGTLFFDEVAELSLSAQAKILRVLQERVVHRLGNPAPMPANVRLLAASSRDLEQALKDEQLREDFYYRLNVVSIRMPSLRERIEDLPLLVETLATEQANELGGKPVRFSSEVLSQLMRYSWPGNVRELRNYIERCHILMPGEEMCSGNMLPPDQSTAQVMQAAAPAKPAVTLPGVDADSFHEAREVFERTFLLQSLEKHDWNISRTASDIGMERSQLHRKIKAFGLVPPERESL